jgi:transposase
MGGATAVIPPNANCARQVAFDFTLDRWRHLVENFFCALKPFRRAATCEDKNYQSFDAIIYLTTRFMTLN